MNFWEILFLFIAFQAIVFALYFFFRKKGKRTSNVFLGLFLILFALNLGYNVLYWSKLLFTKTFIFLYGFLAIIWILYPILFYFYTKSVVTSKIIKWKDAIHLLPILLVFGCYYKLYRISSEEKLQSLYEGTSNEYVYLSSYIVWITLAIMVSYILITFYSFRNVLTSLNQKKWFYWILASFGCYVLAMASYFILSNFGFITVGKDYFIMYIIIFFIAVLSYFAMMQPDVFEGLKVREIIPFGKYKKTGLTVSHSLELKSDLLKLMSEEKPYLQGSIRLDNLAEKLNISRHHMSQIINEHFDTNFFDFINSYRIEESKTLLKNKDLTISDVIYSSGFNNRVSFYKAFKRHANTTPSEFRAKF